ncbi:cupin domain-containing protein [Chloroflexota bacterium]
MPEESSPVDEAVRKGTCEEWMEKEGIPIYESPVGVEDVKELPRGPWARLGGRGTFIQTEGTKESGAVLYVVEIPAGGSLEPEKHLYDELIYILRGRGSAEVWHEGEGKRSFEWGEGSLFAMPTNAWHRLVNGGREPALFLSKTNALTVMTTFRNADFVFNCDYKFTDRFAGQTDYFTDVKRSREELAGGETRGTLWQTNFVPDARAVTGDYLSNWKVEGGKQVYFRMASWQGIHSSEYPVGKHHKAHYGNGSGAVLLGLVSQGYSLIWNKKYGVHPFQDGHGDEVIKFDWKPGGIYCSGAGANQAWFHCHYNTGPEVARQLALKNNTDVLSKRRAQFGNLRDGDEPGRPIEYEDEDPEIRRIFEEECRKNGAESTMPPVVYRTDPFPYSF